MINPIHPRIETAVDLTGSDRATLYNAMDQLLEKRGNLVFPDASVQHINSDGQPYWPQPTLKFEVPTDELIARRIPFDFVKMAQNEVYGTETNFALEFAVGRSAVKTFEVEGSEPITLLGEEVHGVILSKPREAGLGIVIAEETGQGTYYNASDSLEILKINSGQADEQTIEVSGTRPYVAENVLMTRRDIVELTSGLLRIQRPL